MRIEVLTLVAATIRIGVPKNTKQRVQKQE